MIRSASEYDVSTRTSASFSPTMVRVALTPSTPGICRSISTTSGRSSRTRSIASSPDEALPTTSRSGSPPSSCSSPARSTAWSSTITTRIISSVIPGPPPFSPSSRRRAPTPPAGSHLRPARGSATLAGRRSPDDPPRPGSNPAPSSMTVRLTCRPSPSTATRTALAPAWRTALRIASWATRHTSATTWSERSVHAVHGHRRRHPGARRLRGEVLERRPQTSGVESRRVDLDQQRPQLAQACGAGPRWRGRGPSGARPRHSARGRPPRARTPCRPAPAPRRRGGRGRSGDARPPRSRSRAPSAARAPGWRG